MKEQQLEQKLRQFDFSLCHPVREELLGRLLAMQRLRNAGTEREALSSQKENLFSMQAPGKIGRWHMSRMADDEMDWVAAAGTGEGASIHRDRLHKPEEK